AAAERPFDSRSSAKWRQTARELNGLRVGFGRFSRSGFMANSRGSSPCTHRVGTWFSKASAPRALLFELRNNGLRLDREKSIKVWYGSSLVGKHRLDLLVG